MSRAKRTDKRKTQIIGIKETARNNHSSNEDKCPFWMFDNIDKDGSFRFDPRRIDFDSEDFLIKMLAFSNMTWREIKKQTHDDGKTKHHFLSPISLSHEAGERIIAKRLTELADCIFSFSLNNTVRIIGIRDLDTPIFHVIWYDAHHKFAPSSKKHT